MIVVPKAGLSHGEIYMSKTQATSLLKFSCVTDFPVETSRFPIICDINKYKLWTWNMGKYGFSHSIILILTNINYPLLLENS